MHLLIIIFFLAAFLILINNLKMPSSFFENQKVREELYRLKLFKEEENLEKTKKENEDNTIQEVAN